MHDTSQQFLIASQVLGARVSTQNEYEKTLVHLLGDLLSTQAEIDNIQINAINIFNKRDGPALKSVYYPYRGPRISVPSTLIGQLRTSCNYTSWGIQYIWLLRPLVLVCIYFYRDTPASIQFKIIFKISKKKKKGYLVCIVTPLFLVS